MRHLNNFRKLNKNKSHRKLMFVNMIISLLKNESIKTTLAKAKELRRLIEPIITKCKTNNILNKRLVFNKLRNRLILNKLFNYISKNYYNCNGGYLRILKYGFRSGDNAPMAIIQFKNFII